VNIYLSHSICFHFLCSIQHLIAVVVLLVVNFWLAVHHLSIFLVSRDDLLLKPSALFMLSLFPSKSRGLIFSSIRLNRLRVRKEFFDAFGLFRCWCVVRIHVFVYPDCFVGMPAVIVLWRSGLSEDHVETCPTEAT
jgi:hypothetical protein